MSVIYIRSFQDRCNSLTLDSGIDYRLAGLPVGGQVYHIKQHEGDANDKLDKLFQSMASVEDGGRYIYTGIYILG